MASVVGPRGDIRSRADGVKSGRGGRALLSGLMTCGRCGRRLGVAYTGNPQSRPVYRCDKPNLMMGLPRCMTFGGPRVDAAIAKELLRTVEPMAIEAALEAERGAHAVDRYQITQAAPRPCGYSKSTLGIDELGRNPGGSSIGLGPVPVPLVPP
jgi:Recombinase zinc beta ribbon domain